MKSNRLSLWLSFGFSVVLSAISLVAYSATGGSGAWIPAFLAFTPMSLFFGVLYQNRAHDHIEDLEVRLRELEATSLMALSTPRLEQPVGLAVEARVKAMDSA